MKKSLYLLAALSLLGTNVFAKEIVAEPVVVTPISGEVTEENVNEETQIMTMVEVPEDKWSFNGRMYLETENFDNSSKVNRGTDQMNRVGGSIDGLFWGTGISASKDKLTLDLNVERRYVDGLYSFKDGTNDRTRVDWKVRYQLLENQGFHVKYRNEKGDGFRRDRFELGTDWNYFNNMFAGWFVVGHDIDKGTSYEADILDPNLTAASVIKKSKRTKGSYWEGDFGPSFKVTENLSINPTIYTTGEFYDGYEMVDTQLRIMTPYQVNDKLTIMPRIRITLNKTFDVKNDATNGDYKRDWDSGFGGRIRYELMGNYVFTEQLSTFVGVAFEHEKRDFKNSDILNGKNGKESLNMWWGYVGLNYKFN
ncbi:hypothetical protein [Candidatus Cetobacterium colombiensis]|uniref:Protochlamydia outer membrane protein domain-containing protein n=1 Tax=Candidatus Cetobacterium colombiensis TaxID=3073100 RepID=A0ABU4W9Z4_9FUSO|nr:hypothetical protein [Candidatus Cetobacterium colombiensis]MDX8335842.1 hypothetical protein [Candidatus Cetobacterium colombiensis]